MTSYSAENKSLKRTAGLMLKVKQHIYIYIFLNEEVNLHLLYLQENELGIHN